jgi:WD40 repeat protein
LYIVDGSNKRPKVYLSFGSHWVLETDKIKQQKVVKDYGKVHVYIKSMAITADDRYLFTSDSWNSTVK